MSSGIFATAFALAACLIVIAAVLAFTFFRRAIPTEAREYMDPLSLQLKMFWPGVRFFSHYFGRYLSVEYLESSKKKLLRSGMHYLLKPEEFFGLKITSAIVGFFVWLLVSAMLDQFNLLWLLMIMLVAFYMPTLSLSERRKKREKEMIKILPVFMDFISMAVESGLNLNGALQQAVIDGPEGPLKVEFSNVIRDIKAGMARADALRNMAERVNLKEVNSFVSALVQAEKTGASIAKTLKIQAEQRTVERFQRAEKQAMEAPVKLMFPLVAFIFPVTFLVIGFPIAVKFLDLMGS